MLVKNFSRRLYSIFRRQFKPRFSKSIKKTNRTSLVNINLSPGALLIGRPYGVLGRGEDIRTAAEAFVSANIPFSIRNAYIDGDLEDAVRYKNFSFVDKISTSHLYKTNIFFLNANEMDIVSKHVDPGFYEGRYNIGYWAWELSKFPDEWSNAFHYVDEIWAPSRFIQQAVSEKTVCPVIWMPLAVEPMRTVQLSRKHFNLPDKEFLFLFFFDFRSFINRKNPIAVINAFIKSFQDSKKQVRLIIKMNGMDSYSEDYKKFLDSEYVRHPQIMLIDKILDDYEIKELVRLCDCFVSLHRSEGFGRGLAEAMYFGKPVIATGYSGNLDFMNEMNSCLVDCTLVPVKKNEYPYGEGQVWADPDIDMAAWYMRRLVEDSSYSKQKGSYATEYIKQFHSSRVVGIRCRRRLEKLGLLS